MRRFSTIAIMCLLVLSVAAQDDAGGKMSPLVRRAMVQSKRSASAAKGLLAASPLVTAFVKTADSDGRQLLEAHGCRVLASFGNLFIAAIPADRIGSLVAENSVQRIEAGRSASLLMDTVPAIVNALPAYAAQSLSQAYTGEGVVVGLQDIGFDLTHPNFYDEDISTYRIKRFWDFLSADTVGSTMYVGAEYVTEDEILAYAHSRDGYVQTHGTHTLGSAAGSGAGGQYRGIAYNSDICLVSNAVNSDTLFISDDDLYKFTTATDALGFKYIFDYADEVGKPCVLSFSEGTHQGFSEDDRLYYETLDSLVGPGHIIVAAAGNEGSYKTYFHKEQGTYSAGTFIRSYVPYLYMKMQGDTSFVVRLKLYYGDETQTIEISTDDILSADTTETEYMLGRECVYADTVAFRDKTYYIEACGYTSFYDSNKTAYELYVESTENIGQSVALSVEVVGGDADVEVYKGTGYFISNSYDTSLDAGEYSHSIYSPASAPAVIAVGATSYRTGNVNYLGSKTGSDYGTDGTVATYSSIGPTYDGRVKPETVAPGSNVISSCSSYFIENNIDDAGYMATIISTFEYNDRVYGWYNNTGTSMSTPVVAGAVALWLQADASLTPDDVRGVLSRTCNVSDTSLEYPNNLYGYGEIDAYAGLLDVLGLTGVDGLSASQPRQATIGVNGNEQLVITFDEVPDGSFTVAIYTTAGIVVSRQTIESLVSTTYTSDISALPSGIYAVQLTGNNSRLSGSALIRKR